MNAFLEKLDRMAGRWLYAMDEQLQQPLVHTMTGEVFVHGNSVDSHAAQEQPLRQTAASVAEPGGKPGMTTAYRPTALRKAEAMPKR